MKSFEQIAGILESMASPQAAEHFRVEWLVDEVLAVGRSRAGGHCIFIVCDPLAPTVPAVERSLRFGQWQTRGDVVIRSNLLTLPSGEQFGTATAAIAAELLRRRASSSEPLSEVFSHVEEFIALVLRSVLMPPDFVLGLLGELLILDEYLGALGERAQAGDPTAIWRGWTQQARDFMLGTVSLEIKTTGLQMSRHQIHGLDQIEPRRLDGGATESLFLGSIGLRRGAAGAYSVAGLTNRVLEKLGPRTEGGSLNEGQTRFLDRLAQYGPRDSVGYVHTEMADQDLYTEGYTTTFPPRFYDMADGNLRLIRSSDLAEQFPHVRVQGIAYTIDLPAVVPGSIENPKPHFRAFLQGLAAVSAS